MKKLLFLFSLLFFYHNINAQSWIPVGNGLNYLGYVNTLFVYDSVMYAGGVFTSPGNNIAQWNGTTWNNLGYGINNEVYAIAAYKGNVYMGGWFSEAGGHSAGSIAKWNGSIFSNAGFDIEGGIVNALQVYDSLLYVGGEFDSINHNYIPFNDIFSWDNNTTKPVNGADTFHTNTHIYSLSVYAGNLALLN